MFGNCAAAFAQQAAQSAAARGEAQRQNLQYVAHMYALHGGALAGLDAAFNPILWRKTTIPAVQRRKEDA